MTAATASRLGAPAPRRKADPIIALIDIIFQILIFFMLAGRLATPLASDLTLVNTTDLETAGPPDALILLADGSLIYAGNPVTPEGYLAALSVEDRARVRLVPDRAVPAARLVEVATALRTAGAEVVTLVTEQGLQ